MKILAVESSASAASAAVWEDGKLLCEAFTNVGLTHSQTLLPLVEQILSCAQISFSEIGCYAVAVGPGSFTGVRIGVSLVKGLAFSGKVPCVPVSTLEAMARLFTGQRANICCAMDAGCGQVYNALFEVNSGAVTRLCEDRAIAASQLGEELAADGRSWILTGDGATLCWESFGKDVYKRQVMESDWYWPTKTAGIQSTVGSGLCGKMFQVFNRFFDIIIDYSGTLYYNSSG